MNSILNERSFDIMTSVAGDGYIESKNEYSFGLESNSILGSIMKWRSKEYAAADKLGIPGISADTKENTKSFAVSDQAHSSDPFRQKVAGLGRATSLLDESNNSDIFARSRENSYRSAAHVSPPTMPSMTSLHISKPTASPVADVSSHVVATASVSSTYVDQYQQLRRPVVVVLPPPPTTTTNVVVPTQPEATIEAHVDKKQLEAFFSTIPMSFLNPPRLGKKLLVLDLDHTLLDFTRKEALDIHRMKRPFMDEFLTAVYPYYDLALWSQTHWKYIDIKVTQLGIVPNPNYKICFILDKTSMYNVSADKAISNKVKPLQLIWSRYPNLWSSCNTVHVDDIEKNFLLNKSSGILITPFNRSPLPLSQEQQEQQLASISTDSADSRASNATGCSRSGSTDAVPALSVPAAMPAQSMQQVQCGVVAGCGTRWKHSNAHRTVAGPSQAPAPVPPAPTAASPSPDAPLQASCGVPDRELAVLSRYLVKLAAYPDVSSFDHSQWNRKKISV